MHTHVREGSRYAIIAVITLISLLLMITVSGHAIAEEPPTGWERFEQPRGKTMTSPFMYYWVYTPEDFKPGMPLVVYLHSSGGLYKKAMTDVFPTIINDGTIEKPKAVILIPQFPGTYDMYWANAIDSVRDIVDKVIKDYQIDESRISLTGYSLGGIGVFDLANLTPGKYAHIMSICGRVNEMPLYHPEVFKDSEVYIITVEDDRTIDSDSALRLAYRLKEQGSAVVTSELAVSHKEAPTEVYKDRKNLEWLWMIPAADVPEAKAQSDTNTEEN